MSQKDQIFIYWAQQLGYLKDSHIQEWKQRAVSFEQYIQETSILKPFQIKGIQLLFIRHCLWSEMQKQQLLTTEKVQSLLSDAVAKVKKGELGTHFTDLEKIGLNLNAIHQIASAYYQKKVFSDNDYKIFEQMLQEARISMSAASINLEASPTSPISELPLYERALQAAGEADQTVGRLNFMELQSHAQTSQQSSPSDVKRFGPYEILDEIGAGGMGKVYKARDTELDKTVAVKVMLSDGDVSEKEKQRFITEAQLMAKLQHSNIVRVFSAGQYEGKNYIAMEFVEGEPLSKIIKRENLTPKKCLKLMLQICETMGYAHKQKIIHRDLKPSNVMITKDDRALVMDFGLAKSVEGGKKLTKSGELLGTPQYMSPEQAGGETRKFRPTTDVYALGAIMYEMLTGQPTVDGDSTYNIIFAILNKDIIPPRQIKSRIARDLETICLKALEKEPQRRYKNAALLADDIKSYLNGEAIEAKRASAVYRWRKKLSRNKWMITACTIVVVTFITLGYMDWQKQRIQQLKEKEKAWTIWWQNFIQIYQQDQERAILYQKELATASKLLQQLHQEFQNWQSASKNDMSEEVSQGPRQKWGDADAAYQKQKEKMISLRNQEQGNTSITGNLIRLTKDYKELSKRIQPIQRIHKKMEQEFLDVAFDNVQKLYSAKTRDIRNYNPARIMQDVIFHIYMEKYVDKSHQTMKGSQKKISKFLRQESSSKSEANLSTFEQQKIFLHHILLFDPDIKVIKRHYEDFSVATSFAQLQQISQAKYRSVMEQIIQSQSPSIETLDNFRYKLHEICMIDTDFASPYYRIGRLLQQIKGRHRSTSWYFDKSLNKSTQDDFFLLYFQLNSLFEIFLSEIKDQNNSSFGKYNHNRAQLEKHQEMLQNITIGTAQKDYQKLNQVYEKIWNYLGLFFQEDSPIFSLEYFADLNDQEIDANSRLSIAGRWYNFPFCPPGSEHKNTKTFDLGITTYLQILKLLNEITDDNLSTTVALRKAQIYEDLARLTHLRGWSMIKIPPELEEIKATVSLDQVYSNYHKVLENNFDVQALRGLAQNYALLGDFPTATKLYRQLKEIDPISAAQYVVYLQNLPPSFESAEAIEKALQKQLQTKPDLGRYRSIITMNLAHPSFRHEDQMALHTLALIYHAIGDQKRLAEIKKHLHPVHPDPEHGSFGQKTVSAYTGLVYTILALQEGDLKTAEDAVQLSWEALSKQSEGIGTAKKLGGLVLPYLKHYRNPFFAPQRYQVVPERLLKAIQGLGKDNATFNSNFTNHIGIINQLLEFIENNPKTKHELSLLLKKATGSKDVIYTILYYLSNKTTDVMEIRLERTSISSSPITIYQRATLFFRKFLKLRKQKKSPLQQQRYLQQIVQSLLRAIYKDPSNYKYHYSLAVAAGYLAKDTKYRELVFKHLKLAAKLGMKDIKHISQEPAFKNLKRNPQWQQIIQLMKQEESYYQTTSLAQSHKETQAQYQRNQFQDVILHTRLMTQKILRITEAENYKAFLRLKSTWQREFPYKKDAIKQKIKTMYSPKQAAQIIKALSKNKK